MTQKFFSDLRKAVSDFSQLEGLEKVHPIILVNKITQQIIQSNGGDHWENIDDKSPRELIWDMVTNTIEEFDENLDEVVDEYINSDSDLDVLNNYFTEKQLSILKRVKRYKLVEDTFKTLISEDPSFQLILYLWPDNKKKFDNLLIENFSKIAPPDIDYTK